ncbi:S8 family peptidase [Natronosalvus caseinilyticus]|uniref:S8 family peptidase n=1 Tax=Natronosalvus caseinilyticus TaxID=2953747 RepID=UPI0028B2308E|nr:S8 family serine peptidase [Natronosalvus caseinilyticus]
MSGSNGDQQRGTGFSRRTFVKATGVAVGAALAGGAATNTVGATDDVDPRYLNWRALEARHAWDRGYRGRTDRTIALTDSGLDSRHPDLGPWNGVQAFVEDDQVKLTKPDENDLERVETGDTESFSGTMGPGTFASGEEKYHEFTTPSGVEELDASLSWSPFVENSNDLELRLDEYVDGQWETAARAASADMPETIRAAVTPDRRYRFVIEAYINTLSEYDISGTYFAYEGERTTYDSSVVFEGTDGTPTADTPKTVGWYDAGSRYGFYERPRDENGHGTHCASIMGGSGRASAVDPDTVQTDEPRTALSAVTGNYLAYEVDADAGTGVFGSAFGELIEVLIEGPDGQTLERTTLDTDEGVQDNVTAVTPAEESGTYTVYVRTAEGELATSAYVDSVAAGAFCDPETTAADRTGEHDGFHSGIAPNASLVCLQGLSGPTEDLGRHAEDFADLFNMRAVNMSWGYVGGLPLGAAAGTLDRIPARIKEIADAGVLTVAAAGNAATPVNGNGSPAVADEAISVVATGPLDGISAYSSGGIGGIDEEDYDTYMKPDVTAPGGYVTDLANAADTGVADQPEDEQPPIRGYTGKAGTSMASPYTNGTAGLVAQAMEEDAPSSIALPEPTDTTFDDVMRLKQVLLATASETALTAEPHHRAKVPTYDFGGRDPFEGYGRVNPGPAIDAVTRELSGTSSEVVGLNVPEDERAAAGYVQAGPGTVTASVEVSHLSGGDKGAAKGDPHVDLFVYDAANPADNGEPNVLGRAQGLDGAAETSVSFGRDAGEQTVFVVAKLVNIPGCVNGDDVQVHFDLSVDVEDGFFVDGNRDDDASVFTGGQTNHVELTANPSADAELRDVVPAEWDVLTEYSDDVERVEEGEGVQYVYFGTAAADTDTSVEYFVEAPDELLLSDTYAFGPAEVDAGDGWVAISGTSDSNVVVGQST